MRIDSFKHKSNMIRNVYESFLQTDEDSCERHWKRIKKELEDTFKNKTFTDLLIHMNQNEIVAGFCPISFTMITDEKDSQINRCHINAPFLSYYNDDLYLDENGENGEDTEYKKEFNKRFKTFVSTIFTLAFGKDSHERFDPQDVIDVEKQMLDAMNSFDPAVKEAEDGYNVVSANEAHEKYHLNWNELTKGLGFKMPYTLRKQKTRGYKVCKKGTRKCFSKRPLTKRMAKRPMRALYLHERMGSK